MEIASLVVAVLAVVAAGAAAIYARGANVRADTANTRAKEALDLQKRIDDRQREFRDVTWEGTWLAPHASDPPKFALTNTGLTPAEDVTVVLTVPRGGSIARRVGTINPRESKTIDIETAMRGSAAAEILQLQGLPFAVHWASPKGQVGEYSHPGVQVF